MAGTEWRWRREAEGKGIVLRRENRTLVFDLCGGNTGNMRFVEGKMVQKRVGREETILSLLLGIDIDYCLSNKIFFNFLIL
jgi:hypothetical protein